MTRPGASRFGLLAGALGCLALAAPSAGADQPPLPPTFPPVADLPSRMFQEPLVPHETIRITQLTEDAEMSALLVQIRGTLPAHLHRRIREVLYLIQGEGVFRLDDADVAMRPGSVVRVEPGHVHTFTAGPAGPAVFLVVTSPRWDEADRVMLAPYRPLSSRFQGPPGF